MPKAKSYKPDPGFKRHLRSAGTVSAEENQDLVLTENLLEDCTDKMAEETRKGPFLFQVVLLLLACLPLGLGIEQRLNYGTIFKDKGELVISTEQWKHTYLVDLHLIQPNISFSLHCTDCEYLKQMYPHVAEIYNSAMDEITEIVNHINTIIPEHKSVKERSRRSLLPFVGSVGKTLFGFAVTEDVDKLANHVNSVIRKTNFLSNAFVKTNEMLTSFMQSTDNRLSSVYKTLAWNHNLLKNLSLQLNETYQLNEQQNTIQMAFMKMRLYTDRLKSSYNNILTGCSQLIESKLPEILIPYKVLASSIQNISYSVQLHGYKLFSKDPLFYYKFGQFQFFRFNKTLYITLTFPMMVKNAELHLYEVLTYPVPINNTSTHVSQVSNVPQLLATSRNNLFYAELDSSALTNCKTFHTKSLCFYNIALTPREYKQCSISLFEGNKIDIQTNCYFKFIPNLLSPNIRQLNETHFIIFNTSTLILNCPSRVKQLKGCHFCLMTIPCNCSITTVNAFIPKRLTMCHHHSVPVTVLYPVNLALLQQFFNNNTLKDIQAHTSFTDLVNITIPNFKIFEHNYTQNIAQENFEHLNLKKMVAIAKKNNVIYSSLAEPLLENTKRTNDASYVETVLSIVSLTCALVSLLGFFILSIKFRQLTILYSGTKLVSKVDASLPSFHFTTTTQAQQQDNDSLTYFEISTTHIIIMILGIVVLYKILLFCFRTNKRNALILDVTNGSMCVQIPIMYLPSCVKQCKFSGKNILTGLTVRYKVLPSVYIDFGDLKITDKLTQEELKLPKCLRINPIYAFSMRKLLKSKFAMCLWIKQGQTCIPVDMNDNCTASKQMPNLQSDQVVSLIP